MYRFLLLPIFFISFFSHSQSTNDLTSPYELNWAVDGPWLGIGLGLTVYGNELIKNKDPLTEKELASLSKDDIFFIDRWVAGNYSKEIDERSYIPFHISFGLPLLLLINENERNHAGQIGVMYVEAMAITGALYTLSAALIDKSRPLVYNSDLPIEDRVAERAQRSFFGGHTAASATATFFVAKIFSDFNPDSWAKPYVWTAAALVPAYVGYLRTKSGHHFLTDNLIGYAVGALSGILTPEFHKKENQDFDISPSAGFGYQGISLRYRF